MSTNILEHFEVPHPQASDDNLLSEARSGNQQAFAELCLRYRGMLINRIYRIVRHQEDTEDVLQETFLRAYQHLHTFRGACSFSTWLVAIGTNLSLMLLRRKKTLSKHSSDAVTDDRETRVIEWRDSAPDPEQACMMSESSQQLKHAVARLSPRARTLLEMYYKSELPLKDVSQILGIPVTTTKSRLLRAREVLRRSLKQNKFWTP